MEIAPAPKEGLASLSKKYGVRLIIQFGSTVAGHVHPKSDLDLAILFEKPDLSLARLAMVRHELQELFQGREVDIAVINRADPLFLQKITERCGLLYGNPTDFHSLKTYSFRRYQDHLRFLDLERRYVKDLLARILKSA